MLLRIFQGSNPMAASTTPTRIDSRIRRNATDKGEPPRKRYRVSLVAGNSLVSFGIDGLPRGFPRSLYYRAGQMGNRPVAVNGYRIAFSEYFNGAFASVRRYPKRLKAALPSASALASPA